VRQDVREVNWIHASEAVVNTVMNLGAMESIISPQMFLHSSCVSDMTEAHGA